MQPTSSIVTASSRQGFFARHITTFVGKRLPRRFKRLMYISSIMGLLEECRDPDMAIIEELNQILKIAKYPDAFIFPMYIKSLIWNDVSHMPVVIDSEKNVSVSKIMKTELSTEEFSVIGAHFANRAPSWLKYGSLELMAEDVIKLVQQLKRHHSGPVLSAGLR